MVRLSYIVGMLCWLLVSLTPAQASAAGKLALGDVALAVTQKVESCHKLTLPAPVDHQCSGMPVQAAATARSRQGEKHKSVSANLPTGALVLSQVYFIEPVSASRDRTVADTRRSHFWHVYAFSMRMRN
ncbi:MAG: hypothetical protein JXQ99_10340 [Hyphomicrobiaceae bacterium]